MTEVTLQGVTRRPSGTWSAFRAQALLADWPYQFLEDCHLFRLGGAEEKDTGIWTSKKVVPITARVPIARSSHSVPLTMLYTGRHILVWDFGLPLTTTSPVFFAVSRC